MELVYFFITNNVEWIKNIQGHVYHVHKLMIISSSSSLLMRGADNT